ncbi:site-specific integrase [Xanthocytophaga agilis]|uniref:Site-specific integrase n=1 Tax=Xanthocytophaga agilis TaxID=3048010 RepID=A0AAE3R4B0_9BACT|nr:site-specific integrase [Xanthocytophaga agilis]MDJ1503489.1 site-specific integrase [Xanthocytophaga agilis]
MITIRYKPLKNGKYSIYLDIYVQDATGKMKREYEFLKIYVSEDYSVKKRLKDADKESVLYAEGIKAKKELEFLNGNYGLIEKKADSQADYLTFLTREVKRKTTNVDYNLALLKHTKVFLKDKQPTFAEITRDWCEDFKSYLLKNVSQNTARSYLQALKLFLNIAIDKGFLLINPMQKVTLPKLQDVERTTLDIDELKLLIQTPTKFGYHIREAFLFSCFTGLRISDIRLLKWSDIRDNRIYLRPAKTSEKIAILPLTENAKEILNSLEKEHNNDLVFYKLTINKSTLRKHLTRWGTKAGIKQNLHFHAGRHTFATIGISNGIDLYTMKEMLVHSKIDMTMVYAKIVDKKKVEEVAKFPKLSLK